MLRSLLDRANITRPEMRMEPPTYNIEDDDGVVIKLPVNIEGVCKEIRDVQNRAVHIEAEYVKIISRLEHLQTHLIKLMAEYGIKGEIAGKDV